LWNDIDVEEVLSATALARSPEKVKNFLEQMRNIAADCQPSPAHLALARAEQARSPSVRFDIVTQNIDSLHEKAGSRRVHEIHGNLFFNRCTCCNQRIPVDDPRSCCGRPLRPDVVLFGELLPCDALSAAEVALRGCDYFVAIGTSGVVWPAAGFVQLARASGAQCININLEKSGNPAFHEELIGSCDDIVSTLFAPCSR
jgi:NAD-dependent deacetylase